MNIPMVDLGLQYRELKSEIDAAVSDVFATTQFILGPQGEMLEKEMAAYLGVKHAIGVASGTDALHLALKAAGLGEGDEIITTPFTFIATAEAVAYVGSNSVFVDIDPGTFNLDVQQVMEAITAKTRAILPVHLFGQPADLTPLKQLCEEYGLLLIEDCAQSCGAAYQGKMTGAWGDLGCFSFFPSKNLGCYGDGGMVVTDDDRLAEEIRVLRNHGSRERYQYHVIGMNSRLDELQAAILRVKLRHLDRFNQLRRENAHHYSRLLAALDLETPYEDGKGRHVYHQYTVLTEQREAIQSSLADAGIASGIYYPVPLHRQEVFARQCEGVTLPVSERISERVLSLPIYPELTGDQIERIVEVIAAATKAGS
jgi:dTDP-4-amino-4,6-dideoxygalactose transaminase